MQFIGPGLHALLRLNLSLDPYNPLGMFVMVLVLLPSYRKARADAYPLTLALNCPHQLGREFWEEWPTGPETPCG